MESEYNKEDDNESYFMYKTNVDSFTEILFYQTLESFNKENLLDTYLENDNSLLRKFIQKIKTTNDDSYKMEKTTTLLLSEKKLFEKFETYIKKLSDILNLKIFYFFVDESDFFKQNSEVNKIHEFMLENNFERKSLIIGLGGGKITDLSGYVASTYFRGINIILIPTNLLSMVDASIGGKTGLNNMKYGKNVIGTISQPNIILINFWMLDNLPDDLVSDGMAEVIKMSALIDKDLFNVLKVNNLNSLRRNKSVLYHIVKKNIKHKINVISSDIKDTGFRNILNFGHTVGHAIESLEAFNISHGKSVSIGLCAEVELAIILKKSHKNTLLDLKTTLENYNLPTEIPQCLYLNVHNLIDQFKSDKKNNQEKIRFIFLKEIGKIKEQKDYFLSLDKSYLLKYFSKTVFIDNSINLNSENESLKEDKLDINGIDIKHIKLKGSKSICNRALLLSAMGEGDIVLENFLFSEDTLVMIRCLKALDIDIQILKDNSVLIRGKGTKNFENKNVKLFIDNAGTAARFLTSFSLLFRNSIISIDGIERMRERPIDDLIDSLLETREFNNYEGIDNQNYNYFNDLTSLEHNRNINFQALNLENHILFDLEKDDNKIFLRNNFEIKYLKDDKRMPFTIITASTGFEIKKKQQIKINSQKSSQFVSSLLLISPFIKINYDDRENEDSKYKNLVILISDLDTSECMKHKKPISFQYIEMTLKMMELWNVKAIYKAETLDVFEIKNSSVYRNPNLYVIEPDASTANFYLAYVALNGGNILLEGIGKNSIQGDSYFINFIKKIREDWIDCEFNQNDIRLHARKFQLSDKNKFINFDEDLSIITDSFMALGIICSQIPGEYYFRGIGNQAIKECNRLKIFSENLSRIGVCSSVLSNKEGIYINSSSKYVRKNNLNFVEIKTANDHRIAMSFAILGKYLNNTRLYLDNKSCVNKTYPEFWTDFNQLFGLKYSTDNFNINKSIYSVYRENYLNKPIFLVGMRSCGKTTFGKIAAENLQLKFYDFDDMLTEKHKKDFSSIKDMVEQRGWEYFRSLERELFWEIYRESYKYIKSIIACGGGIVENKDILIALKTVGIVIFIDTSIDDIENFIKITTFIKQLENNHLQNDHRPSYLNNDLKNVYSKRFPKFLSVSKLIFKTPKIHRLNDLLNLFEVRNQENSEREGNIDKIKLAIKNFNDVIHVISDIFTNFIFLTCNPMKFSVPHDNSFFLCCLVDENILKKIRDLKIFLTDFFENKPFTNNPNIYNMTNNNIENIFKDRPELKDMYNFLNINFSQYNAVELRFDYFLNKILEQNNNEEIISLLSYYTSSNLEVFRTGKDESISINLIINNLTNIVSTIIQDFRFISLNKVPILFTIRSIDQGGFFNSQKYLKEYNLINKEILIYGIEYIDIEFRQNNILFIEEFYTKAKDFNTTVVLSDHFIEREIRNDLNVIKKDIYTLSLLNYDIAKIITNFDDFYLYKKEYLELKVFIDDLIRKPLIFFQLGEGHAKISRLLNKFFLPVYNENLSLPAGKGQLSLLQIHNIDDVLNQQERHLYQYKVIGSNVTFSPSPQIYEICLDFYKKLKNLKNSFDIEFTYHNISISDEEPISSKKDLEKEEFYKVISHKNLLFASITIPFKSYLLDLKFTRDFDPLITQDKYLKLKEKLHFSQETIVMKSVNCIKKVNEEKLLCFNTDWIANYEIIIENLEKINKDLSEIKILILGAGGAATAVIFSLQQINFLNNNIYLYNRNEKKSKDLAKENNLNLFNENKLINDNVTFDLIISTIPKDGNESLIMPLLNLIRSDTILLDLAYTKLESGLETNFKKILGQKTHIYIDGIHFLLKQAFYSFEIYYSKIAKRENLNKFFLRNNEKF